MNSMLEGYIIDIYIHKCMIVQYFVSSVACLLIALTILFYDCRTLRSRSDLNFANDTSNNNRTHMDTLAGCYCTLKIFTYKYMYIYIYILKYYI